MGSFRDLDVYRRAVGWADEIAEAVATWESFDRWTVGVQLVRAADSVGANLAEASGRWSKPDQRRIRIIARGSLLEAEHWLDRGVERDLSLPPRSRETAAELGRMLNGLIRHN